MRGASTLSPYSRLRAAPESAISALSADQVTRTGFPDRSLNVNPTLSFAASAHTSTIRPVFGSR